MGHFEPVLHGIAALAGLFMLITAAAGTAKIAAVSAATLAANLPPGETGLPDSFTQDPAPANPPAENTAVLLVYMCGSDLESSYGEATVDLLEMQSAELSGALSAVIMTGGTTKWHNDFVSADANYLVTVGEEGLCSRRMAGELRPMSEADTLCTFLKEAAEQYPAGHYGLVMWGHGISPVAGFCSDEVCGGAMSLGDMRRAVLDSGVKLNWIGFDSCLMGSVETAVALHGCAEHLIASADTESSLGWEYANFLSYWAENPGIPTQELARIITESMVAENRRAGYPASLACYDLGKTALLRDALCHYLDDIPSAGLLPETAAGKFHTVDTRTLVTTLKNRHTTEVLAALEQVVCTGTGWETPDPCGMTLWFGAHIPADEIAAMQEEFRAIGFPESYIERLSILCG